jgi:ligand-binding sensor domain-containing protein/signal transduction histidine kinase
MKIVKKSLIIFILFVSSINAEDILPNNRSFNTNQGLSQSTVLDVVQDSLGYLWLATQDGINKFDGYDFTVLRPGIENGNTQQFYRCLAINGEYLYAGSWGGGLWRVHLPTDSSEFMGFNNMDIRSLVFDDQGVLWIAASNSGIFSLSSQEEIHKYPLDKKTIINTVFYHPSGHIFAGTNIGLFRLDPEKNIFIECLSTKTRKTIEERNVLSLEFHNSDSLWIGTQKGLILCNFINNSKEIFNSQSHPTLTDDNISKVFKYSNELWIGSYSKGLYKLDLITSTFTNFSKLSENEDISQVHELYADFEGNLIIGTNSSLIFHNNFPIFWQTYVHDPDNNTSLPGNKVWQMNQDSADNLWVGTNNKGLVKHDSDTGQFISYSHDPENPSSISNNSVFSVLEDSEKRIWAGTNRGLNILNQDTGKFRLYLNDTEDESSLSGNSIWSIFQDSNGTIWVGTRMHGLNQYIPETDSFKRYYAEPGNPQALHSNFIYTIFEDNHKRLWIGTIGGGLHKLNTATGIFTNFKKNLQDASSLPNDFVLSINQFSDNQLWITTNGGGIALFTISDEKFKSYQEQDGLPNNVVYSMIENSPGKYWLSTNNGLSEFNTNDMTFRNFDMHDGLPWLEFNGKSYSQTRDGNIYFGANDGILLIMPDKLRQNNYKPIIRIQNLEINNSPISTGEMIGRKVVLEQNITYASHLNLYPEYRQFSVEFSNSSYMTSQKNEYRYILEGFDKEWIYTDSEHRKASYTNLPSGNFTLVIEGSNNEGIWNHISARLGIKVIPIWYRNRTIQMLFIILTLLLVFVFVYRRFQNIHRQNFALIQVITNLAHEMNSPLGAIGASNYSLRNETDKVTCQYLKSLNGLENNISPDKIKEMFSFSDLDSIILNTNTSTQKLNNIFKNRNDFNTEILKDIIDRLVLFGFKTQKFGIFLKNLPIDYLDVIVTIAGIHNSLLISEESISKTSKVINTLKIFLKSTSVFDKVPYNIRLQIEQIINTFKGKMDKIADISISIPDNLEILANKNHMHIVWENLITNALDSASEQKNGFIIIESEVKNDKIFVKVIDNGPIIPRRIRGKVFKPFFSTKVTGKGRGLGLNVTKQIIESHNGNISFITSKKQTVFTVTLPAVKKENY